MSKTLKFSRRTRLREPALQAELDRFCDFGIEQVADAEDARRRTPPATPVWLKPPLRKPLLYPPYNVRLSVGL